MERMLQEIASRLFNPAGQDEVAEFIAQGDLKGARDCMLESIARALDDEEIEPEKIERLEGLGRELDALFKK